MHIEKAYVFNKNSFRHRGRRPYCSGQFFWVNSCACQYLTRLDRDRDTEIMSVGNLCPPSPRFSTADLMIEGRDIVP